MIGKRKRDTAVASRKSKKTDTENKNDDEANYHDLFRKHFEARFKPIETAADIPKREADDASDDEGEDAHSGSEWDGISDREKEEEDQVEVIAHEASRRREEDELAKLEFKSFMTSKPPSTSKSGAPSSSGGSTNQPPTQNDATTTQESSLDAANLKHDLALQRLLKESHLLDSASNLNPTGANRHKAIDLRMQTLGSKSSIFAQQKMPIAHRKGIIAKSTEREVTRRREARENGIILEKPSFSASKKSGGSSISKPKKRERGVGGPSVGSFNRGMLKLSKRDVMDIQGPKKKAVKGKGKGKGKRSAF